MTDEEKEKACNLEIQAVLKKYGYVIGAQMQPPIPVLMPAKKEESPVVKP